MHLCKTLNLIPKPALGMSIHIHVTRDNMHNMKKTNHKENLKTHKISMSGPTQIDNFSFPTYFLSWQQIFVEEKSKIS